MKLLCNACFNELDFEKKATYMVCSHCLCRNEIITTDGIPYTIIVHEKETRTMESKKKVARIGNDLILYLEALNALKIDFTDVINDGIALYINQLSEDKKKKVARQISLLKEKDS